MNAVKRFGFSVSIVLTLLISTAHAGPIKVAILDFWDARNQTADTRPSVVKLAEEIRSLVSADARFSLVERDLTGDIMKEWLGMYAFGEDPPNTGGLAGAERYLFSSAELTSSGWVLRFRVVEYPSGRIISAMVEDIPSLRDARARQSIIDTLLRGLAEKAASRKHLVAVGSFENATRYPFLDKSAARVRELLEQKFSGDKSIRLLERVRTDRLVEEMRLMEMGGDLAVGFDTHGLAGIFLIHGAVSLGTGVVRTSDMNVRLSVDAIEIDRALTRKLFEGPSSTLNLQPAAERVHSTFLSMLAGPEGSGVGAAREAELHMEKALTLAAEASVHGIIPRDRRYPPISATTGQQSPGRKEILEAAIREADNAIFLNPKLDEAWYIRAVCLRTDQIARYDEALDILLDLSKRPAINADLRLKVQDQITRHVGRSIKKNSPPGRHEVEAEKAREELMQVDDHPGRRIDHAQYLVYMAIHRWKDSKKALERGRQLLELLESYRTTKEYSLGQFGDGIHTYLDIGTLPDVDDKEILADVRHYTEKVRPEEAMVVWRTIGRFHHKAGRLEEALLALERALELFRGVITQKEIVDEIHAYDIGLETVHLLMATLRQLGQTDRAISIGEEFAGVPDDSLVEQYHFLGHDVGGIRYQLAQLYESRRIYARALVLYEEANRWKYRPNKGNVAMDIRRIQARLNFSTPFPLKNLPVDDAGLPSEPVTAIASTSGKIWVGLFPGAERGIPHFLFAHPPRIRSGGGLYVQEAVGGWNPVRVPGILSDVPVTSLAVSGGMLWVGTYGDGLVSQNLTTGEWTVFKEDQGLPMNHVLSLHPDANRIWIGFGDVSRGGIGWIDIRSFKISFFSSQRRKADPGSGPPAAPVTAIARKEGMIYAAEYRVGVKTFSRNVPAPTFSAIVHQRSDTDPLLIPDLNNRVSALMAHHGKIWIGCFTAGSRAVRGSDHANGGVAWIEGTDSSRSYFEEQGLPTNSVTSLAVLGGTLVAGANDFSEGGLAIYDAPSDQWIGTGGFRVLSLHSDGKRLYVGTDRGIRIYE